MPDIPKRQRPARLAFGNAGLKRWEEQKRKHLNALNASPTMHALARLELFSSLSKSQATRFKELHSRIAGDKASPKDVLEYETLNSVQVLSGKVYERMRRHYTELAKAFFVVRNALSNAKTPEEKRKLEYALDHLSLRLQTFKAKGLKLSLPGKPREEGPPLLQKPLGEPVPARGVKAPEFRQREADIESVIASRNMERLFQLEQYRGLNAAQRAEFEDLAEKVFQEKAGKAEKARLHGLRKLAKRLGRNRRNAQKLFRELSKDEKWYQEIAEDLYDPVISQAWKEERASAAQDVEERLAATQDKLSVLRNKGLPFKEFPKKSRPRRRRGRIE